MWPWLSSRGVVKNESDWEWVDRKRGVQGLCAWLKMPSCKRVERIAIYRKRIGHAPVKGRPRLRVDSDEDLRREHGLAEAQHPHAQSRHYLSASDDRNARAALAQTYDPPCNL